jgi:membrane protease YdiL (CAAX protease family)
MTAKRVLVRFLYFTITLLLLLVALQVLGAAIARAVPLALKPSLAFALQLAICAAMLCAYRFEVRLFERREAAEAAINWRLALYGALGGAILFCLVMGLIWAAGFARFDGAGNWAALVPTLGRAAAAAVGEEIVFRGAVFRILEQGVGTPAALLVSALLFGAIHAANPGATLVSDMAIALEAGVLLGLAYAAARNLWLPIGIHFGWNFTEGGIFGAAVSGNRAHGVLNFPLSGSAIVTGGAFGPEASIVSVAVCLSASLLLGFATLRLGRWRPARFAG